MFCVKLTMLRVLCGLAIWLTFAIPNAPALEPRRNVVLIMADDLNCDLGCFGNKQVRSPNIDRLAARGVRFEHAYCQYPVCNPSRVSMLSGRRPQTTRVVDLVTPTRSTLGDAIMLPEYFRKSGYATIKLGKIFHTGAAFEDRGLGARRVVLVELRDLLEELAAARVVQPRARDRLLRPAEAGEHVADERRTHARQALRRRR